MSIHINVNSNKHIISVKTQQTGGTVEMKPQGEIRSTDYNSLLNLPTINGVPVVGDISLPELGLRGIYYDTTENWSAQTSLIAQAGSIYIYSDWQIVDGQPIAGIKIGDGTSYLVDMPFISSYATALLLAHINNTAVHVTDEERNLWNNKVSSYLDAEDNENLILSKTLFTTEGDIYNG